MIVKFYKNKHEMAQRMIFLVLAHSFFNLPYKS